MGRGIYRGVSMKYALVDEVTNEVKNLIEYNGTDTYQPAQGLKLVELIDESFINIGDIIEE